MSGGYLRAVRNNGHDVPESRTYSAPALCAQEPHILSRDRMNIVAEQKLADSKKTGTDPR